MKIISEGEKYSMDSDSVKQYEGERICDEVEALESSRRGKFVLVYSPRLSANILCDKSHLFHLTDQYKKTQDVCPKCASNNIANENDGPCDVLVVTCHDCSYQWTEPMIL